MIVNIYKSNTLMLARTFLALCFISTLLLTPIYDLFPNQHMSELRTNLHGVSRLNFYLWFDNIYIPFFISVFGLFLVILGVYPRITCIIQGWISYSIFHSMLVTDGGDQINMILNFLLIPICLIDDRKNGWQILEDERIFKNEFLLFNTSIALVFIKIQMAVLYFNASVAKMFAPEWINGTAVYYWFNDPTFGGPIWFKNCVGFLFENNYTITFITWYVMILEIALFVGIFLDQKYKYVLFLMGFTFHFLIFIVHGLPSFGLSMTAGLILFYFQLDKTIIENLRLIKLSIIEIFRYEKRN